MMKVLRKFGMPKWMSRTISCLSGLILFSGCSTSASFEGPRLGMRFNQPYTGSFGGGQHAGLDIDVPINTPVKSIADGYVRTARTYDIRGISTNVVVIEHANGISSRYLHIDNIKVTAGEQVMQGQVFAYTALNGPGGPFTTRIVPYPHLHLEVYKHYSPINPESLDMKCTGSQYIWPVGCK